MPDYRGVVRKSPVLPSQCIGGSNSNSGAVPGGQPCVVTSIFFKGGTAGDQLTLTDTAGAVTIFDHTLRAAGQFFLDLPHPLYADGLAVVQTGTGPIRWSIGYRVMA